MFQPNQEEQEEESHGHLWPLPRAAVPWPPSSQDKLEEQTSGPRKKSLLHEGKPKNLGGTGHKPWDQEDRKAWELTEEDAFKSAALCGRSGYRCPSHPSAPPCGLPTRRSQCPQVQAEPQAGMALSKAKAYTTCGSWDSKSELLPQCWGLSGAPRIGSHEENSFNLTDMPEAPEHLREPHLEQLIISIRTILKALVDPYWALESKSSTQTRVTRFPPWAAPTTSLALSLPFLHEFPKVPSLPEHAGSTPSAGLGHTPRCLSRSPREVLGMFTLHPRARHPQEDFPGTQGR